MIHLIIHGPPITKKNSQQIIMAGKRPCIIPSKAYRLYEKDAKQQICLMHSLPALAGPVHVKTLYYLANARVPDLCNLLAASHDILEACGVIENDKQIVSVDGSRIAGIDRANPRVEIEIKEINRD